MSSASSPQFYVFSSVFSACFLDNVLNFLFHMTWKIPDDSNMFGHLGLILYFSTFLLTLLVCELFQHLFSGSLLFVHVSWKHPVSKEGWCLFSLVAWMPKQAKTLFGLTFSWLHRYYELELQICVIQDSGLGILWLFSFLSVPFIHSQDLCSKACIRRILLVPISLTEGIAFGSIRFIRDSLIQASYRYWDSKPCPLSLDSMWPITILHLQYKYISKKKNQSRGINKYLYTSVHWNVLFTVAKR